MAIVKTLMKESDGMSIEARILKSEHEPYSVEYYVDGRFKTKETYQSLSLQYVESAAEHWFSSIKKLNG